MIVLFAGTFVSCEKDDINNTDTQVGISTVTVFPTLTLNGSAYMAIPLGGTFTDPGVVAKAGTASIAYTTTGSVNTATAGVYQLTYSAKNADGFTASVSRNVIVYETAPSAAANDFSGNYARTTNGSVATWTKLAPGVYTVFNPGGAPGTNVTVFAINPTGNTIKIPVQKIGDGTNFSSSSETYTPGAVPQYTWTIVNSGYGTAARTFVKQ